MTDIPCALFWEELIAAYPDANVILTVRDSADAWYASYASTIGFLTSQSYAQPSSAMTRWVTRWLFGEQWGGFDELIAAQVRYTPRGTIDNEKATKRWYEEHNRAVMNAMPADRHLVFNAKQGWEPLCRFLRKTIPDTPYPRVFEKKEYLHGITTRRAIKRSKRRKRLAIFSLALITLIAVSRFGGMLGRRWP